MQAAWDSLVGDPADEPDVDRFDPASLDELPAPAARWLRHVVPEGAPLRRAVALTMSGSMRLGPRWLPFTAEQVLRAGVGFVWRPVVGGRLLRFTGADVRLADSARMEFRLHGLVPVARASGTDTLRSATGRLAAETVAWLPQAATPQAGARWEAVDDDRAVVTLATSTEPVDVEVAVADDGRLTTLGLQRWNDSADPPGPEPFGGEVSEELVGMDGVRVAGAGQVGWGWGTASWPEAAFLRYSIESISEVG